MIGLFSKPFSAYSIHSPELLVLPQKWPMYWNSLFAHGTRSFIKSFSFLNFLVETFPGPSPIYVLPNL